LVKSHLPKGIVWLYLPLICVNQNIRKLTCFNYVNDPPQFGPRGVTFPKIQWWIPDDVSHLDNHIDNMVVGIALPVVGSGRTVHCCDTLSTHTSISTPLLVIYKNIHI